MENITWKIEAIKSVDELNGFKNVITEASWLCVAEDEEGKCHVSGTEFLKEEFDNFICFNDVKEDDVLKWCFENGINKNEIESLVISKLKTQKELPKSTNLPWS